MVGQQQLHWVGQQLTSAISITVSTVSGMYATADLKGSGIAEASRPLPRRDRESFTALRASAPIVQE